MRINFRSKSYSYIKKAYCEAWHNKSNCKFCESGTLHRQFLPAYIYANLDGAIIIGFYLNGKILNQQESLYQMPPLF